MKLHQDWLGACVLAALPGISLAAFAASPPPTTLGQVVVTATRTAQTEDATLAPVTVITRAEIELLQPASLQALLDDTPGMAIANSGGPGKATSMFLRGTNADQTLVLVDGVRVGNVTAGTTPIQDIPVDQIQRIEIVRGPFSSLYGSGAIGGVVQIFLRHTPGSFVPNANVGFGSYSHWKAGAGFSAAGKKGWLSLQASGEHTDGIQACRLGAGELGVACFADLPGRDGFSNHGLTLNGEYQFNPEWSADGMAFATRGLNHYAGTFSNNDRYTTQVLGGQLHYQPSQDVKVSLRAGQSADFDSDFLNQQYVDTFNTRRTLGSLVADIAAGGGLLTTGADWQRDSIASSTVYSVDLRTNRALFAQWLRTFGTQSVQASVRHDRNSQFGGATTGSLLWGWNFARDLRLSASYGTAFRAPTFNDLYYPGFSNPDLKPERSRNFDIGLRGTPDWGHWSVNVYRNTISQAIALNELFVPENIERVRITGLEGVIGGKLLGWDVRATATLMNDRDATPGSSNAGRKVPRQPRQSARVDVDRSFGRFSFGASESVNGYAYDNLANTHRMGGYALTNLRAGWKFNRDWQLQLALNNVFNKDYETVYYYNQPGRNYMLTLRWQPPAPSK
ncbi:MAG TPA: TonB-dependent vitamin B12 receptor [Rhodanobacteraceae bacterium]